MEDSCSQILALIVFGPMLIFANEFISCIGMTFIETDIAEAVILFFEAFEVGEHVIHIF